MPGYEGSSNVKWLRRIELATEPFMTREETSKYTDPLPDDTARLFSLVMDAKSIITEPAFPDRLSGQGWWEIRGIAWTGRGRITRVDVSTDGGKTWHAATLDEPVLPKCHTRFRFAVELERRRSRAHEPCDRRDRIRAADPGCADGGTWAGDAVSLQQHPGVAASAPTAR